MSTLYKPYNATVNFNSKCNSRRKFDGHRRAASATIVWLACRRAGPLGGRKTDH
jgi:hypothetical protein